MKHARLVQVLQSRKGVPLLLAIVTAAVGSRLGVPLTPIQLHASSPAAASPSPEALQQLPKQLATLLTHRVNQAGPTTSDSWLLRIDSSAASRDAPDATAVQQPGLSRVSSNSSSSTGSSNDGLDVRYVHARDGSVMTAAELEQRHPGCSPDSERGGGAALTVWRELVRTAVAANQRRGDSDAVAHWTYILLALDTRAGQWDHVLGHLP